MDVFLDSGELLEFLGMLGKSWIFAQLTAEEEVEKLASLVKNEVDMSYMISHHELILSEQGLDLFKNRLDFFSIELVLLRCEVWLEWHHQNAVKEVISDDADHLNLF